MPTGAQQRTQEFERAAVAGENDDRVREMGVKGPKPLTQEEALMERQRNITLKIAQDALQAYAQRQPQANRSAQQVHNEIARTPELRAIAGAQITPEMYEEFMRAMFGSGKTDSEGT